MKKLLVMTTALVAFAAAGSASAADLPAAPLYKAPPVMAPVFTWTGFYIGVSAGGHWDTDRITASANPVGFVPFLINVPILNNALATSLNPKGFIGGGQIGYNWQTGNFVLGLEADASGMSGTAQRTLTGAPLTAAGLALGDFATDSVKATFLGTVRGRVGVTFDRVLLYATGGAAWGTIQTTDTFGAFSGTVVSTISNTTNRFGWTVGGGVEFAIANNWSFKAEYLYVDLGNFTQTIPAITGAPNTTIAVNHAYTENIARVGLNYRFGGPVVAAY